MADGVGLKIELCPSCGCKDGLRQLCSNCNGSGKIWVPDLVNHPPHYTSHPSGVECITVVEHMVFNLGTAIAYIWRADLKGNAIEDLEKAVWYVQRELERRRKSSPK